MKYENQLTRVKFPVFRSFIFQKKYRNCMLCVMLHKGAEECHWLKNCTVSVKIRKRKFGILELLFAVEDMSEFVQ